MRLSVRHGCQSKVRRKLGTPLSRRADYDGDPPHIGPSLPVPPASLASSRNSTPRRKCGITIEPPTISAMSNASHIYSSLTPAFTH
jgi:hypothetical protein